MKTHENYDQLTSLFQQDPFARWSKLELIQWSGGQATVTATPDSDHLNFAGGVHGGFLFGGADFALSVASNSWGRMAVAVSVDIHYVAPGEAGAQLTFTASELSRGRNMGTYALEVRHAERLIATATGVTFRTNNWHFGQDSWSSTWQSMH